MQFKLEKVVPWGRNFEEYTSMFDLSEIDLDKKIISFGDGPASFNAEMNQLGKRVTSVDPIYGFNKKQLESRIHETKTMVIDLARKNKNNFVWDKIESMDHLEEIRMSAMEKFLEDYEKGVSENRYICHELPKQTNFKNDQFDIGLSSHFLILYAQLGLDFHIQTIKEMLRVAKEIRIFPLLDLDAKPSVVLPEIIRYFEKEYTVQVIEVDYEFQKEGNKMLRMA